MGGHPSRGVFFSILPPFPALGDHRMDIILLVNKMYLLDFVEPVSVVLMSLTEATRLRCGAFKNGISSGRIPALPPPRSALFPRGPP